LNLDKDLFPEQLVTIKRIWASAGGGKMGICPKSAV